MMNTRVIIYLMSSALMPIVPFATYTYFGASPPPMESRVGDSILVPIMLQESGEEPETELVLTLSYWVSELRYEETTTSLPGVTIQQTSIPQSNDTYMKEEIRIIGSPLPVGVRLAVARFTAVGPTADGQTQLMSIETPAVAYTSGSVKSLDSMTDPAQNPESPHLVNARRFSIRERRWTRVFVDVLTAP